MVYRWIAVSLITFLICHDAALADDAGQGSEKPSIDVANTAEVTATVEAIDPGSRTVVLRGPEGREITVRVQDDVDLDDVDVGDKVVTRYREAVAIRVTEAGDAAPGAVSHRSVTGPKPGEKPSREVLEQTVLTATVEKIDRTAQTVTLKGPGGKKRTLQVQDAQNLQNVEVGDTVTVVYTEALAIAVGEQPQ